MALAAGAVLAVVAAVPAVALSANNRPYVAPKNPEAAVPAQVYAPFPFQATAQRAPTGPAALLLNGGPSFRGSDLLGYEDRSLVVGRDGSYRVVRSVNDQWVGETLLLSPDGRYVAAGADLEGAPDFAEGSGETSTSVLDLTTGQVRGYPGAGRPVAWSPDGHQLLTKTRRAGGWLDLMDLRSGQARKVFPLVGWSPAPSFVAFSPDGSRLAVQRDLALHVVDVATGTARKISDTGPRRRLAGPGGWTPDGRIAVWDMTGCDDDCDAAGWGARALHIAYLDPEQGAEVAGPQLSHVTGLSARILGWQRDGDAVVAVLHPNEDALPARVSWQQDDGWGRGGVEVVALYPGGGRTELIALPLRTDSIDIAHDLLMADRFGGPVPRLSERFADWLGPLAVRLVLLAVGLAALLAAGPLRRRFSERSNHVPSVAGDDMHG